MRFSSGSSFDALVYMKQGIVWVKFKPTINSEQLKNACIISNEKPFAKKKQTEAHLFTTNLTYLDEKKEIQCAHYFSWNAPDYE